MRYITFARNVKDSYLVYLARDRGFGKQKSLPAQNREALDVQADSLLSRIKSYGLTQAPFVDHSHSIWSTSGCSPDSRKLLRRSGNPRVSDGSVPSSKGED